MYVLNRLIAKTDFERVGNFIWFLLVILAKAPIKVFKKGDFFEKKTWICHDLEEE